MKFLGISFDAGKNIKLNSDERRKKFIGSFNAIYSRIGCKDYISTLVFILSTICVPALLYGIEEIFREDNSEKRECVIRIVEFA